MQMVFKSGEKKISSAVYMNQNENGASAYAMSLDLKSGKLVIDRARSYRLLIEGDVNSSGVFSRVSSYQGFDIDVYSDDDQGLQKNLHSCTRLLALI